MSQYKNKNKNKTEFRNALSLGQKHSLFFTAISDATICQLMIGSPLDIECFQEIDLYLWYIWEVTKKFYKRHRCTPTVRELRLAVGQRIDDPSDPLDDDIIADLADFLDEFEDTGQDSLLKPDIAQSYLHDFLADKIWRKAKQITSPHGQTPESIRSALDTINSDLVKIESLSSHGIEPAFATGYEKTLRPMAVAPFGLPFMDASLGGGCAPGEVCCVLGPYGGGKTTLLEQLSLSLSLLELARWLHSNRRKSLGISYFVSYEMQKEIILYRALAHVAQIPFTVLLNNHPLSSRGNLSPRDYELFQKQYDHGLYIPSERERKESAEQRLRQNWKLLDFSGFDIRNPYAGGGKCEEIMQCIDADIQIASQHGLKRHVAGIFIDYIGMMAKRYCIVNNKDMDHALVNVCNTAVDDARRYLAHHFRCPVFMSHQLNAVANKLKPGQVADRTDSANAKTVAENCDFIFVGSKPTDEHNLVRLSCQKRRRMKSLGPVVLQLQGEYAQLVEASSHYAWDDVTKQFTQLTTIDPHDDLIENENADEEGSVRKRPYRFDGQTYDLFDLL
jgi:RecA/RadA recombinase